MDFYWASIITSLKQMIKRIFDIFTSAVGIVVLSPIMLIISLAILILDGTPIFFTQTRIGKNSKPFRIFKFKTMKPAGKNQTLVTQKNDNRITAVGKILRLAKLDELPQLFNVFLGSMSIVGPRPEIPELVECYTKEQRKLLKVKPGITSPATIYHRDEEEIVGSSEEILEYHKNVLIPKKASFDLAYIENHNFIYDLKIIFLTLLSVLTNQSGYMREKTLKQRRVIIFLVHIFLSFGAYYLSYLFRFDGEVPSTEFQRFLKTSSLVVMIETIYLSVFELTQGYWRYVDFRDVINIGKATFCSTVSMFLVELLFLDSSFPSGTLIIDGVLSFILFTSLRFSTRFLREIYSPITPKSRERVLILGASDRGEALVRDIIRNPDLGYEIAGFIDIDLNKRGIKIHGLPILGGMESLEDVLNSQPITSVINTYPTLDRDNTAILSKMSSAYKFSIKTLPTISDVLSRNINFNKLRDLRYEDLLGREEISLDRKLLHFSYKDKVILITGAGGSIGSELCRQIANYSPKQLVLLDKDETLLFEITTELNEYKPLLKTQPLIGDIRNRDKMDLYFKKYCPEIVLHAAAYKHVPLLEKHPQEAILNNVIGTKTLLDLSLEHNVKKFVMISTDKAVRPTSVMGASKALSEKMMFDHYNNKNNMNCMAVRFGNVLGSRGSVIPIFKRQIENGGPIKITHPKITRYFMSIPEATQLVLQAGAMGRGGEIFILKMGQPVKIKDLATRMIEHAGFIPDIDIKIEYSGLRNGEKLYEELLTDLENTQSTEHEKIYVIHYGSKEPVNLNNINQVQNKIYEKSNQEIRNFLSTYIEDYKANLPSD